jgi:hypothetical protein
MPDAARRRASADTAPTKADLAAQRFVSDLIVRGEAAPRDATGKVPHHATHEITKEHADGSIEVKRVRFKTF